MKEKRGGFEGAKNRLAGAIGNRRSYITDMLTQSEKDRRKQERDSEFSIWDAAGIGTSLGAIAAPFTAGLSVPIGAALGTGIGALAGARTSMTPQDALKGVGTVAQGVGAYMAANPRLPKAGGDFHNLGSAADANALMQQQYGPNAAQFEGGMPTAGEMSAALTAPSGPTGPSITQAAQSPVPDYSSMPQTEYDAAGSGADVNRLMASKYPGAETHQYTDTTDYPEYFDENMDYLLDNADLERTMGNPFETEQYNPYSKPYKGRSR